MKDVFNSKRIRPRSKHILTRGEVRSERGFPNPILNLLLLSCNNVDDTYFYPVYRLFQVEYAIEAVKLGSTAVGIQTSSGIILAVEKRLTSTLLEPSSVEKILEVDFHIGAAVSGLSGGTC